ncbi:MAG: hypothetical protein RIQ93_2886 [Verrucomicrobiota bacterium]|jgi:hypothetical protein
MRYVIIRDDDTNALTPVECLERLYRPFLERGLPVNLAVVPDVRSDVRLPDGRREGFLLARRPGTPEFVPLASNAALTDYLHDNPSYNVAQHGCHHDYFEFDLADRGEIVRRLEHGALRMREAGFANVSTFVAPHDKLSRLAYQEVARRFPVISTGWFELRRLPPAWWPRYAMKKLFAQPHWRFGRTRLLSHPGCLLSHTRPLETMLDSIKQVIARGRLTVLVTHWWEYFRAGHPDEKFIAALHETARYLATQSDICVTTFDALASGNMTLPRASDLIAVSAISAR